MLEKHISFTSYAEIKSITAPLKQSLQLKYFGFSRIFHNKTFIHFSCDPLWPEYHYFKEKQPPACLNSFSNLTNYTMFPATNNDQRCGWSEGTIQKVKQLFDITHPILVIKKYEQFADLFLFEFKLDNPYEVYFNHHAIIEQFLFYFKDKAQALIKSASASPLAMFKNKIYEPAQFHKYFSDEEILNGLKAQQYRLHYKGKDILLTQKQYRVLSYIALGFNNKDIAQHMNMSPRTVDDYVNVLTQACHVNKKHHLMQVYTDNHDALIKKDILGQHLNEV